MIGLINRIVREIQFSGFRVANPRNPENLNSEYDQILSGFRLSGFRVFGIQGGNRTITVYMPCV